MSHGPMAKSALESAEMILGQQDTVDTLEIRVDSTIETTVKEIFEITDRYDEEEWLILTDIIGGTPFNSAYRYLEHNPKSSIVAGFNLPMLLEVFMRGSYQTKDEILEYVEKSKTKIISVVNYQALESTAAEDFDL
ncbi:hypothetical protein NHG34_01630 [Aerococcaceae bacterium NML190938]|nr:hypothetical protein [Aerococcaceae bacterium NML190938]